MKESNSFVLTLQKEKNNVENIQRRINIRKIVDLSDLVNKTYESVLIELNDSGMLKDLNELLKSAGDTKINLVYTKNKKNYFFELEKSRKFDFNLFSLIKNKEYVKKISF